MIFIDFLFNLKNKYCLDCIGYISKCEVHKEIINSTFSNYFWCPRCNGVEVKREAKIVTKKDKQGNEFQSNEGERIIYKGGTLRPIRIGDSVPMIWRCSCAAGDQHVNMKRYDFRYLNDDRCFYAMDSNYLKWLNLITEQNPIKNTVGFTTVEKVIEKVFGGEK